MADNKLLKSIAKKRLITVKTLISAGDWEMATYIMGYALECALKAVVCKTLHLTKYPEDRSGDIRSYFMTHNFDKLLIVSGMEDVFSDRGPADAWYHWSKFTSEYQGEWTTMRYDSGKWDETRTKNLYTHLTDPRHGVISEVKKKW